MHELNFHLKIRKMQTNLDIWRSRNLTLFGKVMIIKSLGLSQLVYSASTLNVPKEITPILIKGARRAISLMRKYIRQSLI